VDVSGNVYVTGWSYGSGTDYDYATIKYDTDGNEKWVARYDGPASDYDSAGALGVDGTGNVYVTGYSPASGTSYDYATIKYSQLPATPTPTPPLPVGGIAEFPSLEPGAAVDRAASSGPSAVALSAAVVGGVVVLVAGGWYARRRRAR
ncbi:MAG: hypothetical protein MUP86_03795, partial [Dehalococcoidia bacterium]|nr:hypothetical protein [Dehalococcoidia bacterium]